MTSEASTIRDPVCGMAIDPAEAQQVECEGATYYFCGDGCRATFLADPEAIIFRTGESDRL